MHAQHFYERNGRNGSYWAPLERIVAYLHGSAAWYNFLKELINVLGSYEIQIQNPNAKEGDFSGWADKVNVNKHNLRQALTRIEAEYRLPSLNNTDTSIPLLASTVNRPRLVFLNEIIRATLLSSSSCSFSNEHSFSVGAYVFLSGQVH